MKSAFFAGLLLVAGCGQGPSMFSVGATYSPPAGENLPPDPEGVPTNTPDYTIDPGASVSPPAGAYGITTSGQGDWSIRFTSDSSPHQLAGDIYCPAGCNLNALFVGVFPGSSVNPLADNHLGFAAAIAASQSQMLNLSAEQGQQGAALQPLTFTLYVDGNVAVSDPNDPGNPYVVVFPSAGQVSTSYTMPFNLVSANAAFAKKKH